MISDLIEFGKWLNENKQDDFGKNIRDNDYIIGACFDDNLKKYKILGICQINGNNPHFFEDSIFSENYYIETNQISIIPNNNSLLGITPFLLKIDVDDLEKFYGKVERAKNSNNNDKEFIEYLKKIYSDINYYLDNIGISDNDKSKLLQFFEEYTLENVADVIGQYYMWIYNEKDQIVPIISQFKETEQYKETKGNFYLSCYFNSKMDLINDIFYYYSKFIKERNKQFKENEEKCSFCSSYGNVYPSINTYVIGNAAFSFNYDANKQTSVSNARIKFCKKCATYSMLAEDKLLKVLSNNVLIIPKKIDGNFGEFLKEMNKEDTSSFGKINNVLNKVNGFNYDLALYKNKKQGKGYIIEKYIENYKSYLARVRKDDNSTLEGLSKILLYDKDKLVYLSFDEDIKPLKHELYQIESIFNFEFIFKELFINIKDSKLDYPKLRHFYEIYTRDLTGKSGVVGNLDSKTFTIFSKYMHSIFNFIYELNPDAVNKSMLNEIVLNCLIKITKNIEEPKYLILKRLNYFLMLNKEILGDKMLEKGDLDKLKTTIGKYEKDNPEVMEEISKLIQENPSLKYYLIGKFLKLIDNTKYSSGKKRDIFGNFVTNANRNNIRSLFVTEVLQKNNYYIQKMNPKGKLVFNLFENDLNSLFNEENGLSFEDYLLSIFAGYYTENILKGGDLNE